VERVTVRVIGSASAAEPDHRAVIRIVEPLEADGAVAHLRERRRRLSRLDQLLPLDLRTPPLLLLDPPPNVLLLPTTFSELTSLEPLSVANLSVVIPRVGRETVVEGRRDLRVDRQREVDAEETLEASRGVRRVGEEGLLVGVNLSKHLRRRHLGLRLLERRLHPS